MREEGAAYAAYNTYKNILSDLHDDSNGIMTSWHYKIMSYKCVFTTRFHVLKAIRHSNGEYLRDPVLVQQPPEISAMKFSSRGLWD